VRLSVRFDMRNIGPASDVELYSTVLEQVAWADSVGFDTVYLGEHHGADDGYLPSPIVMAGAMASVTSHIEIHLSAVLLPLHDPIRLAEDLAVLDLVCGGRLSVTFGMGYRNHEFAMFGVDAGSRAARFEENLATVLEAWSGESFRHREADVRVCPRPAQRPRPPVYIGGSGPASARRAARLELGYRPAVPELWAVYQSELERLGRTDQDIPSEVSRTVFVVDDPEQAWPALAPYVLHTNNSYAQWAQERAKGGSAWRRHESVEDLRAAGQFLVCTPDEALEQVRALGPRGELQLQPAISGLPAAEGWPMLRLFERSVMPHLCRAKPRRVMAG
jgi:alkanesulfonate monooxygenase SsuD/methylene tetrahydromethanopterin reductase-like flavin-dependent oxidoreductase (luciferase family)